MFGYVKPYSPELKVKEQNAYQGIYCGLCRSMGKCTGNCSRLSLNYDFVFLAAVRACLTSDKIEYSHKRCFVHPFKKRLSAKQSPSLEYAAAASAILSYEKLRDDLDDEKGFKRLCACLLLPFASHARKRAKLPELSGLVREKLNALYEIERSKVASVDAPAEKFGELLGEIFAHGLDGNAKRIAYSVGLSTGKWIYATDAADDMEKDAKSGSYNPYLLLWDSDIAKAQEEIPFSLRLLLKDLGAAIGLIDFSSDSLTEGIIKNIVYLGMPHVTDEAVSDKSKEK